MSFSKFIIACGLVLLTGTAHSSLLALYTFENTTDDVSGSGNNPTVVNNISFNASGFNGSAGSFNGFNSYMDLALDLRSEIVQDMTWGAWVNADTTAGGRTIISNDDLSPANFDRHLGLDTRGSASGSAYSAFTGAGVIDTGVNASTGVWNFVAARYDSSNDTVSLFVDNLLVSTTDFMSDNDPSIEGAGLSFTRVGQNPSFSQFYDGLIDNLFIFDTALSNAEMETIRLNGQSGIESVAQIPTPSTLILLMAGFIALFIRKRY